MKTMNASRRPNNKAPSPSAVALIPLTTVLIATLSCFTPACAADRLPPPGITIPDTDRQELSAGVAALRKDIHALAEELSAKPQLLDLLPDVEIFYKAVDWALH